MTLEGPRLKKQKFENFDPFRGPEPKLGPLIKIFHQISYRGLKSYTQYAFRNPTLKKRFFSEFLKFSGARPKKSWAPIKIPFPTDFPPR